MTDVRTSPSGPKVSIDIGGNGLVLIDGADTTPDFLAAKLVVDTNSLSAMVENVGDNETLKLAVTPGSVVGDTLVWDGTEWGTGPSVRSLTVSDLIDPSAPFTLPAGAQQFVTSDAVGTLLETTYRKVTSRGNSIEYSFSAHNAGGSSAQISVNFGISADGGATFTEVSQACTVTIPAGAYASLSNLLEYTGGFDTPIFRLFYTSSADLQIGGSLGGGVLLGRFNQ